MVPPQRPLIFTGIKKDLYISSPPYKNRLCTNTTLPSLPPSNFPPILDKLHYRNKINIFPAVISSSFHFSTQSGSKFPRAQTHEAMVLPALICGIPHHRSKAPTSRGNSRSFISSREWELQTVINAKFDGSRTLSSPNSPASIILPARTASSCDHEHDFLPKFFFNIPTTPIRVLEPKPTAADYFTPETIPKPTTAAAVGSIRPLFPRAARK